MEAALAAAMQAPQCRDEKSAEELAGSAANDVVYAASVCGPVGQGWGADP